MERQDRPKLWIGEYDDEDGGVGKRKQAKVNKIITRECAIRGMIKIILTLSRLK